MKVILSTFLIGAMLAIAAGCVRKGELPVRGTVTLDGAPLEKGSISFRPADPSKSKGSGATIRDGCYEIPTAQGLPPGKYLVTISSYRLTGRMLPDHTGGPEKPEVVAVIFAEKQPVEVAIASGKDNVLDFALTSHSSAADSNPPARGGK